MTQIRFNKYERVAGLFILLAIGGTALSALSVAIKQGWFEPKISYTTTFENADGVHAGIGVKMAGLNAGSVDDVELLADNRVRVSFHVFGKFRDRIREDSKAQLIRPFLIGERVLEVSVGTEATKQLAEHSELHSEESMDLMAIMSGKKMGAYLAKFTEMLGNLQALAEAFTSKERTESMVRIFDRLDPLLANITLMSSEMVKLSRQATKDDNLQKVLVNAAVLTRELNSILPLLNQENPEFGKDLALMTRSLGKVSSEMNRMFQEVGPEAPATARRAIEALNETTVLIKALQKSLLLRGNVREVREEESKDPGRKPASRSEGP